MMGQQVAEASTILEETCSYIKRLRREVDNLSERLSQLMDTADITQVERAIAKSPFLSKVQGDPWRKKAFPGL
ncbi:hypothetical protein FEM48_Zijuj05G0150700 [Ziziphus jujuba var. spinosa]|uniref:Uncharacterized protein n=1 Tax=Ziziphus jujuba var. spinosa TaxID=714518 RepID=A0A978VFI2_ZIZJJ|nr:hypothetical protein FEM48_Zijuj05G0150700 [Ziziphus jujuba var. spinosa]